MSPELILLAGATVIFACMLAGIAKSQREQLWNDERFEAALKEQQRHFEAVLAGLAKTLDSTESSKFAIASISHDLREMNRDIESIRKQTLKISRQNLMDEINRGKFDKRLNGEIAAALREYMKAGNQMPPHDKPKGE